VIGGGFSGKPSVYAKLALASLYLAPLKGDLFLRPSEGVFRRHELPLRVEAFIENYLPLFKVCTDLEVKKTETS